MAIKYKAPKQQEEDEIRQAARTTPEDARQAAQEPEVDIYGAAKDDSVFGEAADQMKVGTPGEIQQQAQDVSADTRDASQDYLEDVYGGDEDDGGAPAPAEEEPQGLFEDVTDIDARQERERAAFADELAARKAEQQQQAEARAGLGGMGLSGATAELTADIGRQAERAGDIAMADLGRRQQQETFDELRRQASIWAFEEEFGVDLDGDGKFGSGEQAEGGQPEALSVDMTAGQAAQGGVLPYGTKPPENSTLVQEGSPGTYDTYRTDDGRVYYIENEPLPSADIGSQLRQAQRGEA